MKKIFSTLAAVAACMVLLAMPVGAAAIDSSTFANQYDGNEIYLDAAPLGTGVGAFDADWSQAGGAAPSALTNSGTNLVATQTANNGWVQQDGGSTPWETSISGSAQWALEVSVSLNDNDLNLNDNMVIWSSDGTNRLILVVTTTGITEFDGTVIGAGGDNTDALHTYQIQYDSTDLTFTGGTYTVYRDTVLQGQVGRDATTGNTRLIVGDCCTSLGNPIDEYEIGHVRFGVVIPEPSTIALAGLALVGLIGLRRRG